MNPKKKKDFEWRAIANLLLACAPEDTVTYEEIHNAARVNPQEVLGRGLVRRVIESIQWEYGIVFECVESVGFVRLTNEQIATRVPKQARKKIENATRRTLSKMQCVEPEKLAADDRKQYLLELCAVGVLGTVASEKTMRSLQSAQKNNVEPQKTLKELIGSFAG